LIFDYVEISGLKFKRQIFTDGFKDPNGPNACTSCCCRHGVYLDPAERDEILARADIIEKYFDETQTKNRGSWFNGMEEEDADFPSGKCVSTEVYNDKCVFLNKDRRCTLQLAETGEGLQRFSLKPHYCVLFPIVKMNGVLQYDDFCSGEADCCTASPDSKVKMVEVCSTELEYAIGISKYNEILSYYRNNAPYAKNQKISQEMQSNVSPVRKDVIDAEE
jgi:Fe-S-cluster containining protein